ncbi:hypothetical protein [Iningainema tapete]|uniref:Uncharacterized protein n=1 Tax=Iningainema tapete BLCC-T55 TaxID=2748662 RepID=A0A8J7BZE0_9CYAN|nr:hypothetical protein [Iningainema tapete]MBD2777437.1 hypothetical protein [Iningainema tapete BLCC-T55]
MKRIGLVGLALFLVIILWGGLLSNTASSQQIESRISTLEADINRLESQVNQLQAQLGNQGRTSPSPRTNITPTGEPRSRRNLSTQERDRMFDRLATLVVELKQQVNKLETRLSKLESR